MILADIKIPVVIMPGVTSRNRISPFRFYFHRPI
jgi:hypothetical protein